jgi:integral membrane sensor domain MASE1
MFLPPGCCSHGAISLAYTAINIIEACIGALLLRKLLPWYNPLQNLNDWVRLAIGSALIPPLVGGFWFTSLFQARSRCVTFWSGYYQSPSVHWHWYH